MFKWIKDLFKREPEVTVEWGDKNEEEQIQDLHIIIDGKFSHTINIPYFTEAQIEQKSGLAEDQEVIDNLSKPLKDINTMETSKQKSLIFIKVDVLGVDQDTVHALIEAYLDRFREKSINEHYHVFIIPVRTNTGGVEIDYLPANVIVASDEATRTLVSMTNELELLLNQLKD